MYEGVSRDPQTRERELQFMQQSAEKAERIRRHRWWFSDENHDLIIFKLDVDYPFFRISNGRTRTHQIQKMREHELGESLFSDPTSIIAQQAQQEILIKMANEADLKQSLIKERQREPILLTHDGVVVNGNRRLAVMRSLMEDPKAEGFSQVDACLLPPLDEKELRRIEMRLQMSVDGKAEYSWVNKLITIRDNIEVEGLTAKDVAKSLRSTVPKVEADLRQLRLIENYLQDRGMPGQFDQIDKQQQAFKDMASYHKKLDKSPALQQIYVEMAFNLINSPDAGSGSSLHKDLKKLELNFVDSAKIYESKRETREDSNVSDRLDNPLLQKLVSTKSSPILISPTSLNKNNIEAVRTAIGIAHEKGQDEDRANTPYKNAEAANKLLQEIEIFDGITNIAPLRGQLKAIAGKANTLLDAVYKLK